MNRANMINFIYNNSKEEFTTIEDVFNLAKENKLKLRIRVISIQQYLIDNN